MRFALPARAVLAVALTALITTSASSADWPRWRGPKGTGISDEKGLLSEWPEEGPKLLWRVDKALGRGFSGVAIAGERIFGMGNVDRKCHLIALSKKDGSRLWATPVGGGNPNCTPTVDGDRVYALGREGNFVCCEVETGELIWSKSFPRDFGGRMMSGWGYSESPLIDGDVLVCTPGSNDALVVALDKKTGETIWKGGVDTVGSRGKDGAGYSSVVISNAGGIKQYVQLTGRGVFSFEAKTGRLLWDYNRIANGTANIPTPLVQGDHVFCSTGYGTGAALLKINKFGGDLSAEEVYFLNSKDLQNHHGGMVLVGDHLYGFGSGGLICLNFKSGDIAWSDRSVGKGSLMYADGHLYCLGERNSLALVAANPKKYVEKGRISIPKTGRPSWAHPVVAGGRLYIRDQHTLTCYDVLAK